jgi:hypothetical protein
MPLLGKRKYINKKIEELITKLDIMGYDTTDIKKRYYDIEEEDEPVEEYSAGSILPYRSKINDVLNMIENLINPHEQSDQQQYLPQNDYSTFKDNLINTVKNDIYQRQQQNNYQPATPKNNSFSLF